MTMSDAAKIILAKKGVPMHVKDLVREIESNSLFIFGAKNPSSVLSGTLSNNSDTFIRVSPGTYTLK